MPRKRNDWGPEGEQIFRDMTRRYLPAVEIAAALKLAGVSGASPATVQRRQKEVLGARRISKTGAVLVAPPAERPPVLDVVPEDADELGKATPLELDWWLDEVKRAFEAAKGGVDDEGRSTGANPAVLASLAARATALLEAKRKAAPPVFVDPNDALDIQEAAERGRKLFHDTLSNLLGHQGVA